MKKEMPIFTRKPIYREKCGSCDGTGLVMTQIGKDDFDQEVCDCCDGNGWVEEGGEQK